MTLRLKILPRAEQDAQHIFDYISERSLQGASTWWIAFEDATKRVLDEFTDVGGGFRWTSSSGLTVPTREQLIAAS